MSTTPHATLRPPCRARRITDDEPDGLLEPTPDHRVHSRPKYDARVERDDLHRHGRVAMLLWLRLGERVGRQVWANLARRKVEWEVRARIRQVEQF